MSTIKKISIILYYVNAVIAVGFGCLYFFKSDLMPYHYSFMEMTASQIDVFNPRILELMKAFKKIIGSGLISIGIGTFISTHFILRFKDNNGVNFLTFLLLMIPNTTLFVISYHVAHSITEGPRPPWMVTAIALVLIIVAFIFELIPDKGQKK